MVKIRTSGNLHSETSWTVLHRVGYGSALRSSSILTAELKLLSKKVPSKQSTAEAVILKRMPASRPEQSHTRVLSTPPAKDTGWVAQSWLATRGRAVLQGRWYMGVSRQDKTTYMYSGFYGCIYLSVSMKKYNSTTLIQL